MGQDQATLDLEGLVKKLRYITAAVQLLPFIYSAIYIICMALYLFCEPDIIKFCDTMFYVSPVTIVAFLIFSKILKMCVWHRTACILPILPQCVSGVDYYVVEFPFSVALITIITIAAMFCVLLFSAYKTFIR